MRQKWVTVRAMIVVLFFAGIGLLLGTGFTLKLSAATSPSEKSATARGMLSQPGCSSCGSPKFTR